MGLAHSHTEGKICALFTESIRCKGWEGMAISLQKKYVLYDNWSCKPHQWRKAERQEEKYVQKDWLCPHQPPDLSVSILCTKDNGWLRNTSVTNPNTYCRLIESKAALGRDILLPRGRRKYKSPKEILLRARAELASSLGDRAGKEEERSVYELPFKREKPLVSWLFCLYGWGIPKDRKCPHDFEPNVGVVFWVEVLIRLGIGLRV